jgi:hypothetical protein
MEEQERRTKARTETGKIVTRNHLLYKKMAHMDKDFSRFLL